jgi:hypothetical protein
MMVWKFFIDFFGAEHIFFKNSKIQKFTTTFFFEKLSMQNVWKWFKIKYIIFWAKSETQTVSVVPDFLNLPQIRIQAAIRCFFGLSKQLQSGHLSRPTKFIIYKSLIRSVVLYGIETWVLTKREENRAIWSGKRKCCTQEEIQFQTWESHDQKSLPYTEKRNHLWNKKNWFVLQAIKNNWP